jgi:hypothetical protein
MFVTLAPLGIPQSLKSATVVCTQVSRVWDKAGGAKSVVSNAATTMALIKAVILIRPMIVKLPEPFLS